MPQKPNEEIRGLAADPVRPTYWIYTDSSLFELVVGNEDRDVWRIYLEKGKYDVALRYAKVMRSLPSYSVNATNRCRVDSYTKGSCARGSGRCLL